jgi:hypothetical protein
MVLDETSIDILRKCQGFIPQKKKDYLSIIEEKQTLEEEKQTLEEEKQTLKEENKHLHAEK